jgi:anaphase-promoting complex subunit 4
MQEQNTTNGRKNMPTANMESSMGPQLLLQAEKILLHPIHPHLISYCPTMDLIAIVTDEENLDVYRINGQRAFGLKRKSSDVTVDLICWEFNGQAIAVAWSDGCTDIVSAETGKVIHPNLPAPKVGNGDDDVRIRCMGWGRNFIDADAVKRRTGVRKKLDKSDGKVTSIDFTNETTDHWDTFKDETSLEDFLQRQPDLQALDMAPDLPDQLAMMDVETLLPKLPAIPLPPATPFMRMGQQADSGAFSTQVQVDSLLHSHHMKDHNSVDMFIRCTDLGSVHPSIYDSLETVNIQLPSLWPIESSRLLLHASHPYSCSHGLLTALKIAGKTNLAFVPLTLGFIPSAGIYLHLISSKTSQLQNLLLYVQQCLQRIRTFWKHSRDLPSKFMMNISETLEEKGQGDLVTNLYHLACTGNCPPVLKEWLVDELAEAVRRLISTSSHPRTNINRATNAGITP